MTWLLIIKTHTNGYAAFNNEFSMREVPAVVDGDLASPLAHSFLSLSGYRDFGTICTPKIPRKPMTPAETLYHELYNLKHPKNPMP